MPRPKPNPEDATLLNALKMLLSTLKAGAKRIDTDAAGYEISAYKVGASTRIDIKPKESEDEVPI